MTEESRSATSRTSRADEPGAGTGLGERLSRSRDHKVIGGVCGGLGRHYHLDPVIFRVPLAVLSVIGGLGFVAYGLAWLIVPFEDSEENEGRRLLSGRVEGPGLTALLFIVAGCGLMLASLGDRGGATWFSVMVLAFLVAAAYWSRRRSATELREAEGAPVAGVTAQVVADAPPEAQAPPVPPGPSWWRGAAVTESTTAERASGYLWGPAGARPEGDGWPAGRPGPAAGPGAPRGTGATAGTREPAAPHDPYRPPGPGGRWPVGRPPVPAEPRELWLGGLLLLLAMCACVVGTAAAWGNDSLSDALVIGLAAALAVFGVGLVVSAFVGRLGGGTIVSVVLTAGMLACAAALPENITTSWSDTEWRPATAAEVERRYEIGTGQAELDLSGLDLRKGQTVVTAVEAGAGDVRLIVPRDVAVTVHVEVTMGAFTFDEDGRSTGEGPLHSWGGVGQERTASYPPPSGVEQRGSIELYLDMGIGHMGVERNVLPDVDTNVPDGEQTDRPTETPPETPTPRETPAPEEAP
ncbi:PspC domain-containing protein [Streptomyces sp. B6B3]|uniref:PspC domain-containing protein n=1 Tax=Streptomyces sp. B6B3 TaxID=3153570 RepID=UPI00325D0AB4